MGRVLRSGVVIPEITKGLAVGINKGEENE